jgi:hypothetical protein
VKKHAWREIISACKITKAELGAHVVDYGLLSLVASEIVAQRKGRRS